MKIGVKYWRVGDGLASLVEKARPDFIEIMAIRGEDCSNAGEFGLPVKIHAEHTRFGTNPASRALRQTSIDSVRFAIAMADRLDADTIVVHPGLVQNPECNIRNSIDFFRDVYDPRIVIENLPFYFDEGSDNVNFGKSYDEMKLLVSETGLGFCLDFAHAAAAAMKLGMEPAAMIKKMTGLKPRYFHISDSSANTKVGDHMHLGTGTLDIGGFKKMLPKNAWVALETPVDVEGRIKDIEFMRS